MDLAMLPTRHKRMLAVGAVLILPSCTCCAVCRATGQIWSMSAACFITGAGGGRGIHAGAQS